MNTQNREAELRAAAYTNNYVEVLTDEATEYVFSIEYNTTTTHEWDVVQGYDSRIGPIYVRKRKDDNGNTIHMEIDIDIYDNIENTDFSNIDTRLPKQGSIETVDCDDEEVIHAVL